MLCTEDEQQKLKMAPGHLSKPVSQFDGCVSVHVVFFSCC